LAAALLLATVSTPVLAKDWTEIRIGIDPTYKPFEYKGEDGQLTGFEVELAKAMCTEIKAKCSFVESSWEGIIPGLNSRKFDAIISSMSMTDARRHVVEFSDKYYQTPSRAIAKVGTLDGSVASFKGKRVGTLKASIQEHYAKDVLAPAGATVISFDTTQLAYLDLKSGRIDAVVVDQYEGQGGFIKSADGKGFDFIGPELTDPKYFGSGVGVAVRKPDTDLRDKFSAAIKAIRANGTYKKIADKYFDFDVYGK